MRVNIFEAGLATLLMAGKGLLQTGEEAPRRAGDTAGWHASLPPVQTRPVPKTPAQ